MTKHTFLQTTTKSAKVIALCALSLAGTQSYAQKGFDVGLNSGVQTSSLINKQDQAAGEELDYSQKIHVPIGINVGYTFTKHMGVELDFIYVTQGQGYKGVAVANPDGNVMSSAFSGLAQLNGDSLVTGASYTAETRFTNIKIPILFRYTGNTDKKVYFHSFIGPQIDMISSVTYYVNGNKTPFTGLDQTPSDMYKKMTLDGVLGVGAGFNLSSNLVLSADLRLEYGLGDVEKKSATLSSGGIQGGDFYGSGRTATNNASGGLMVALTYKFAKKATSKTTKTTTKTTTTSKAKK